MDNDNRKDGQFKNPEAVPNPNATKVSDELTYAIIGAAMKVHRELGMGFVESTYQRAMARELILRRISFETEKEFEVFYEGTPCGTYRADMVIEGKVITELKAVSALCGEHKAQLVSYLKASGLPTGLLMNFGASSLEIRNYRSKNLK